MQEYHHHVEQRNHHVVYKKDNGADLQNHGTISCLLKFWLSDSYFSLTFPCIKNMLLFYSTRQETICRLYKTPIEKCVKSPMLTFDLIWF